MVWVGSNFCSWFQTNSSFSSVNESVKSISEYIPELTIIGSSISKDLGCGGYRLGWFIFTEKLVVFDDGNRKLKEHSRDSNQFAYPVNSTMLMFMDPKTLSTNCIVSPDGDNYKAVIYLELVSETGKKEFDAFTELFTTLEHLKEITKIAK